MCILLQILLQLREDMLFFRPYNRMTSVLTGFFSATASSKPTVGDTKLSLVGADHLGWLICDGRSLNVSDYYWLYQTIGNTYGGNLSNFNLPNPAGYVLGVIGSGISSNGQPLTVRSAGQFVGQETHTLTIAEMPTHNHPGSSNMTSATGITTNAGTSTAVGPGNLGLIKQSTPGSSTTTQTADSGNSGSEPDVLTSPAGLVITDPTHTHAIVMSNQGGSNAHNNMQPTLFVGNMFIYSGRTGASTYAGTYPFYGNGIY
jgi:microcystin-dependent protein